jgi:hypothetical protein
MVKSSIKIVVLPLFIAILLTSFYVMQPQMVDAATKRYKNSGSQSDTPLASDRFDDVAKGYVIPASKLQQLLKNPSTISDSRIDFILEQYVDCERDPTKGTCKDIFLSGTQKVSLTTPSGSPSNIDANFDLTEIQKDDTEGQDNVKNRLVADQQVSVTTSGNGKFDGSHNSNNNEVDLNIYQYNKRGEISESLSDYEIDSITDAIKSDSGSGNDDSFNINEAKQNYVVDAKTGSSINVANKGSDQAFTIAQFNADCDDHDLATGTTPDITCKNVATQNVKLDAQGSSTAGSNTLNFNTLSPIELQQVNTCQFSDKLNCVNTGLVDVNAFTTGTGSTNIELENPNGQPVLFQQNDCSDLVNSPSTQQCTNTSFNYFNIQKSGIGSNIQKTNLDLQVAQKNNCDDATAPIDCVNRGLQSIISDLNDRNIQSEFGFANTIVTVNANGAGSLIEDADPDSFLTMVNDCSGANPETNILGSSNCVNEALNEAHFVASSGADVDVDRVVQTSTTTNSCDNLDDDTCKNTAQNTFVANAANDATININSDVTQTNKALNNCDSAECSTDMLNAIFLQANDGAEITTTSGAIVDQTNTGTNNCTNEATCSIIGANFFSAFADGTGSDIDISKLNQDITFTNTCSNTGTSCSLTGNNFYEVDNTSGETITLNSDQIISGSNNFDSGTHSINQNNIVSLSKSSGTSLNFISSQTASASSPGATNNIGSTPSASGTCSVTQTNGQNSPFTCP